MSFLFTYPAKGIKIIFDFVPNHVSSKHPWFEASANGTSKDSWFLWNSVKLAWNPMGSTNTWHQYGNRYYYGAFNGSMPDLNYRNAEVREEMKNVVRYCCGSMSNWSSNPHYKN